jgi:hypothetical protein
VDGVRRVSGVGNKRGGDGFKGRDSDWHLSSRRSVRAQSRSLPVDQVRKRSHFDDGVGNRNSPPSPVGLRPRHEYSKTMDYCGVNDEKLDVKRVYLNREKDLIDSRLGGGKSIVDQRFFRSENEVGGSYRSIPDISASAVSRYEEDGGHLPPPPRSVASGRFEHERLRHREHLPVDKVPISASAASRYEEDGEHLPPPSRSKVPISASAGYEEDGGYLPPPSRSVPTGRFEHERLHHREHLAGDKVLISANAASRYEEDGEHLPPPSRTVPTGRFEHERLHHREHLPVDKVPISASAASQYEEDGEHLPPPSRSVPTMRFEHERLHHREHLPVNKVPITESHGGADKTMFHTRDVSHFKASPSYAKDFAGTSHLRDYGSSSVEMRRSDFLCSRRDCDCSLTSYDDQPRSSGKLAEGEKFSGHGQRPPIDASRGPEIGQRNITCDHQCECSPARMEHMDYSRLHTRAAQDEYLYQYDEIPRRVAPHGRLDYEQAVMEYDNRELSRQYNSHPDLDRTGKSEDYYYGNQRRGIMHEHDYPASQNPKYVDYHDMRRTPIASKQGVGYLRSGHNHSEIGKRMPNDYEVSYLDAPDADYQISSLRIEYESRRDGIPGLQQERFQSSPLPKHDSETYRQAVRMQEMNQDVGIHNHSDRLMKRKYYANEEIDGHDLRTMKSSKWGATEEYQDYYESEEWVDDEDMNMVYSYNNVGSNHKIYRKHKNKYNELENEEGFPSDTRISPQVSMGHVQRPSFRSQKYSSQHIRNHSKSSSSNWHKSQHFSRRNANQKQPKGWKKSHGYYENNHTTNDESYEDLASAAEPEPAEGSEEFLQMVHENFLTYSKTLNLNLSVQRRYQKQGKAGCLYCIVCGKRSVFFSIMLFYQMEHFSKHIESGGP